MSAEPSRQPGNRPHWIVWLMAIVGLLGLLAIIFLAATIFSFEPHYAPAKVAGETPEESFVIADASPLAGTNLIRITVAADRRGVGSGPYSGGGGNDGRNILLLDRASGATRRLLPDNSRRIAETWFLPAEADAVPGPSGETAHIRDEEEAAPPAYFVLLVAQPGEERRFDLMVGTLGGSAQAYVMQGLEGVDGLWMQSPTRIGLIVRERMNLHYRIIDIPSLRVVGTRRIAI
jgi:hypothetical protein